jgi:hypothetical protein
MGTRSLAIVSALVACSKPSPQALVDVTRSLDAVRADFDAHDGELRFLALLSPT